MLKSLLTTVFCACLSLLTYSQSIGYRNLYTDTYIPSVYITLPQDSLNWLYANVNFDGNIRANFIFDDGTRRDTLLNVGFRLRGNTSRTAKKKSFKVKFNAYTSGRKYQGVKEVNLNSNYNDPTLVREKLYYDVWNRFGLTNRRVNFCKVYLNGGYYGLYTNIEELDDEWAKRVFGVDTGNLYKCTWPADLKYLGTSQTAYKNIMHDATTRAYDLKINELRDDYSDLVKLCSTYNVAAQADIPRVLPQVLDVDGLLKGYAVEIMCGHWDDYAYNKNNYFLYNNPRSGVFQFMSYDADNTFGIDWVGKDWAVRDINAWHTAANSPLLDKVLKTPFYKNRLNQHVKSLMDNVLATLEPRIDSLRDLIRAAAVADTYRTQDYGFTIQNFDNNFETTAIKQAKYGLKSFLRTRISNATRQLVVNSAPVLWTEHSVKIYPNPVKQFFIIDLKNAATATAWQADVFDVNGRLVAQKAASDAQMRFDTEGWSKGVFVVKLTSEMGVFSQKIVVW
jgi:hypothetical protein